MGDGGVGLADTNGAGIVVAAANGPTVDLTVLDLEELLGLALNGEDQAANQASLAAGGGPAREASSHIEASAGLAQVLETADLPADLTELDLYQRPLLLGNYIAK